MTQKEKLLAHLREHGHISQREALMDLDICRCASRIDELRQSGHHIITMMKENPATGQRYARYFLSPNTVTSQFG